MVPRPPVRRNPTSPPRPPLPAGRRTWRRARRSWRRPSGCSPRRVSTGPAWTRSRPRPASPSSPSTAISATRRACSPPAPRRFCEQQLPATLFEPHPEIPLRERLMQIARAFFAMISSPEAVAGHRILCTPQMADSPVPQMFWEAGPQRVQAAFAELLRRREAMGELADRRHPARRLAVLHPAQGRAACAARVRLRPGLQRRHRSAPGGDGRPVPARVRARGASAPTRDRRPTDFWHSVPVC